MQIEFKLVAVLCFWIEHFDAGWQQQAHVELYTNSEGGNNTDF